MITVVGLGNRPSDLTAAGQKAIEAAPYVCVKSVKTAAGKAVKAAETMDGLFNDCPDFDALNGAICDRLLQLDDSFGGVVYCTDGDGLTDSIAAELNVRKAKFEVVRGVSAGVCAPRQSVFQVTASALVSDRPYIDGGAALEITEIADKLSAGEVKMYLLEFYSPAQTAFFTARGKSAAITIEQLDRQSAYDFDSSLFISGNTSLDKERYSFPDLLRLMNRLTAPDGCPWDKEQTHESIRSNLIEEAYEAVDAIDSGDLDNMCEEFGDLLLQAVFHCDIAFRTGEFSLGDVISALCGKLYFRHTHIFGADKAADGEQALKFWEKAKAEEKSYTSLYDILSRLPKGFPSLLKAEKAYKKALKAGAEKEAQTIEETALKAELFALVKRAAASGIDAETALNEAVERYIEGFKEQ